MLSSFIFVGFNGFTNDTRLSNQTDVVYPTVCREIGKHNHQPASRRNRHLNRFLAANNDQNVASTVFDSPVRQAWNRRHPHN